MIEKAVRGNDVGVLISPGCHPAGWGAGWSTENEEFPECLFDADLVLYIMSLGRGQVPKESDLPAPLKERYGEDFFTAGFKDLEVAWIPRGSEFVVRQYDGAEYIELKEEVNWITA